MASSFAWSASRLIRVRRAWSVSALATIARLWTGDQTTFGPRGAGRLSATRTRNERRSPGFNPRGPRGKAASPRAERVPRPGGLAATCPVSGSDSFAVPPRSIA